MTLPAPATVPPIVLESPPSMRIPGPWDGNEPTDIPLDDIFLRVRLQENGGETADDDPRARVVRDNVPGAVERPSDNVSGRSFDDEPTGIIAPALLIVTGRKPDVATLYDV